MADNKLERLQRLKEERNRLDERFVEATRLLDQEIGRIETGFESDKFIELHQNPAKVEFRVRLPVKEYPQANFVGRIVGPSGATIRELQTTSGVRIAVFGKGSIKDKAKEEELRRQGGKYAHLNHDLHVHLYATGNTVSCYKRIALAMELIEPLLAPDYNEDVHQMFRGPGEAFGMFPMMPPRRPMLPPVHAPRGGAAGWPAPIRGPPPVPRVRAPMVPVRGAGRGAPGRGAAGTAVSGRGAPRGRGTAGSPARGGTQRGRGAPSPRGQGRGAAAAARIAPPPVPTPKTDYQAVESYEYEASSAYADPSQAYMDPNAYAVAEAGDAYYDYGQAESYDGYEAAWGEDSVDESGYGKMATSRAASSYRAHPY